MAHGLIPGPRDGYDPAGHRLLMLRTVGITVAENLGWKC